MRSSLNLSVKKPLPPLKYKGLYQSYPIENPKGMINPETSADEALKEQNKLLETKMSRIVDENDKKTQKIIELTEENQQLKQKLDGNGNSDDDKDEVIRKLQEELKFYQAENEKLKSLSHDQNNGIDLERRNSIRAKKKSEATDLFTKYQKMKQQETETRNKIAEIDKDIQTEKSAIKLELETSETQKVENEQKKLISAINSEKSTHLKKEYKDEELVNEETKKLESQKAEVENSLQNHLREIENLKPKMVELGIKPTSFEKPEEPFIEEEDESDYTLDETKERLNRIRKDRNEIKSELDKLKIKYEEEAGRSSKIKEIIDTLISRRIIQVKK